MANIKLFDRKYNALSRIFFFKCIITDCDYLIKYSLDKVYNLPEDKKLEIAKLRDYEFINHLKQEHGLDFLLIPVYANQSFNFEEDGINEFELENG